MAGNMLFYYFGDDDAYFKTLQGEFKLHVRSPIEFKKIYESDEKKIQALFIQIFQQKPHCVFIDFSKVGQDYLHLARIITRTPLEHKMITVGLVDYLSPIDVLKESIATGVNLTHIKSAESFDVVFDVMKLMNSNEVAEHGFARAKLDETIDARIPVKVGFVENEGLHFETDFPLKKGQQIRLDHHWLEKRIVPSELVTITNVQTTNLFYQFKYAVDAEFMFVDPFLPTEGMEEQTIKEKVQEREELIIYHKKQLSKWIEDNLSRSLEKKAKVLVIDRDFNFYENQARTDKHSYIIRCVPYAEDPASLLNRLEPQVIAFALEKDDVKDKKNTLEELEKVVAAQRAKFSDFSPFFVVFNTEISSKDLQNKLQYAQVMASSGDLSVEVLLRMAEVFEKKLGTSIADIIQNKPKSKNSHKVFIRKTNPASISEIIVPVNMVKVSETDLLLQTEAPIAEGMNLHLRSPVEMYVSVAPSKNQGPKMPEYQGLIHCLGEDDKKELRRFVNSVFFRDHDAQVSAEAEEFKKLNEAKLLEKQEAQEEEILSDEEQKTKVDS